MSSLKKYLVDKASALRASMSGGEQFSVRGYLGWRNVGDPARITTQVFNTQATRRPASTVLLFVPGFASVPTMVDPGVLKQQATHLGWDFARFYHPELVKQPSRLTYSSMLADIETVARALPHQRIILAGSSFGAGMMPHAAQAINHAQPGRVAAMFGWMTVTPKALLDLFEQQPGYLEFLARKTSALIVHSPTMKKPFPMTHNQYESVRRLAETKLEPFDGPVLYLAGGRDPVGQPRYTFELVAQLTDKPGCAQVRNDLGHVCPAQTIKAGLAELWRRLPDAPLAPRL